jgi:hypothetical protein
MRIVLVWAVIVTSNSSLCCYGRRRCDLTLSFLACSVGRRRNVGDVTGGLERANGRAASEVGVGRVGELPVSETLYRGLKRGGKSTC